MPEATGRPQREDAPLILFGAADRHNFGDLLLARVAEAEAAQGAVPRSVVHAGLANRDLRPYGGPWVRALGELAKDWPDRYGEQPADLLHIGGEILDCDAWSAAVMLCEDDVAAEAIRRYDGRPQAAAWAAARLGCTRPAPYLADRKLFARPGTWGVRAGGGVGLARRGSAFRRAVATVLHGMARVSVRDAVTREALAGLGVSADLEPDPVSRVDGLFGPEIAARREEAALIELAGLFPEGYVALQFAAEFGDDACLRKVAAEVVRLPPAWGLVCFRAGAAPWHDCADVYRRLIEGFLPRPNGVAHRPAIVFASLHVFDIAALIAGAHGVLATSLHAGIVATAYRVPFAHLALGGSAEAKWRAWQSTWSERASESSPRSWQSNDKPID